MVGRAGAGVLDRHAPTAVPAPDPPAPAVHGDVPPHTPASKALARELKRRGFAFLGPTTVYAGMQACGVVNDHLATCPVREVVQRERDAAATPREELDLR